MKNSCDNKEQGLEKLLREARPEPDAAFTNSLRSTVASLPAGGTRIIGVPRAVIIIAAVVLSLVLGMGVAYASGAFRNLFGSARDSAQSRVDEFNASYEDKREQMKDMDEMEAAILDNEMDAQSQENAYYLAAMERAEQHAVSVEQERDGVILSSISVVKPLVPGPGDHLWQIYFSFDAPEGFDYEKELNVTVDGGKNTGEIMGVLSNAPDAENPAIYECFIDRNWNKLPGISDITVQLGERAWSFRYYWAGERLAKQGEAAPEPTPTPVPIITPVSILTGPVSANELKAKAVSAEIRDGKLCLRFEITAPDSFAEFETVLRDAVLTLPQKTYEEQELFFDKYTGSINFSIDNTRRPEFVMELPVKPEQLKGEEISFAFTLYASRLADEEQPRFEFRFRVD